MADIEKLQELVEKNTEFYDDHRRLNQALGIGLGLLGIALSLGATISGIVLIKDARVSSIFGACAAATQAILFAYPVDKRANAYRTLSARNQNIAVDLEFDPQAKERVQEILKEVKEIRLDAAREESSSINLEEAVKKLETLLKEAKNQSTPGEAPSSNFGNSNT